eukprot:m.254586 g.254586  ORF g.254586 m.254586 type:complete len:128 (-) comp18221_c0_seq1:2536-2919(-)
MGRKESSSIRPCVASLNCRQREGGGETFYFHQRLLIQVQTQRTVIAYSCITSYCDWQQLSGFTYAYHTEQHPLLLHRLSSPFVRAFISVILAKTKTKTKALRQEKTSQGWQRSKCSHLHLLCMQMSR